MSFLACISVDGLSNFLTNHAKDMFRFCRINIHVCELNIIHVCVCALDSNLNEQHSNSEFDLESNVVFLLPFI